jgi:hypothetical protein
LNFYRLYSFGFGAHLDLLDYEPGVDRDGQARAIEKARRNNRRAKAQRRRR